MTAGPEGATRDYENGISVLRFSVTPTEPYRFPQPLELAINDPEYYVAITFAGPAAGTLAAIEALRPRLPVTAQAVRTGLALVELPGRFQIVPGNPTLVLDVAHNPHSVAALAENLDAMGFYPGTHAVFGAMADKDLSAMIARVAPVIDHWYLTDLPLPRALPARDLAGVVATAVEGRPGPAARVAGCYPDPRAALAAAVAAADPADRIVVFGSFYTVGGVLQDGVPRLAAKHLKG